jgi:NAD(P)-dependent dehydrogenase (short-subunit alcohol dehydrogenase family)
VTIDRDPPVAMVTGASRGIGKAIALALADAGYDVALTARTVREGTSADGLPGSLDTTTRDVERRGRTALGVPLDLLDRDALVPSVEKVLRHFGRLDVLVNNAIYVSEDNDRSFLDTPIETFEKRIYADLTAQVVLAQRAARAMVDQPAGGTILNITSGAGRTAPPAPVGEGGWALSYAVAKGGFHRMAGVIAVELGARGVRCINVQPGFVATERTTLRDDLAWIARQGKPPSVVGAVVAWILTQPDDVVRNGGTVEVDDVARALGLLPPSHDG